MPTTPTTTPSTTTPSTDPSATRRARTHTSVLARASAVVGATALAIAGLAGTASAATVVYDSPSTVTLSHPDATHATLTYANRSGRTLQCSSYVSTAAWIRDMRAAVDGALDPAVAINAYVATHAMPPGTVAVPVTSTATGATTEVTATYTGDRPAGVMAHCYDASYHEIEFALPPGPFGSVDPGSLTGSLGSPGSPGSLGSLTGSLGP